MSPVLLKGLYLLLPLAYIHLKTFHTPLLSIILMKICLGGLEIKGFTYKNDQISQLRRWLQDHIQAT